MQNNLLLFPPSQSYKLRVIYCYSLPTDPNYDEAVKVGMTECEISVNATAEGRRLVAKNAAEKRIEKNIKEIYGQARKNNYPKPLIHWYEYTHISVKDGQVHSQLTNAGIARHPYAVGLDQREWFDCTHEVAHNAFDAVVAGLPTMLNSSINFANIKLRPEQSRFIDSTLKAWNNKDTERLWNAKPRFGKTFTALEFVAEARKAYLANPKTARRLENVLIITHRPVVNAAWSEDFTNIMSQRWGNQCWQYSSKAKGHRALAVAKKHQVDTTNAHGVSSSPLIYFTSMQDARGKSDGDFKLSNELLYGTDWDLVIIDEAHEGNLTELAQEVHDTLTRSFTLYLSGTPFRHLTTGTFDGKTDSWDYIDEQEAKANWDKLNPGIPNPYEELPRMWIYTLDLSEKLKTSFAKDEETGSFSFSELFAIDKVEVAGKKSKVDRFRHEEDIKVFLDTLTDDASFSIQHVDGEDVDMPYSDNGRRDSNHSLWVLPPRTEIAKRLEKLLKEHPHFKDYTIVNVAGESAGPNALAKVENAIYQGNLAKKDPTKTKTITLTVGRLTTGVTVGPWTTALMLNNMTSAEAYVQTIFRVQSPHTYEGATKTECFVYDFAPDRALQVIAESMSVASKAGHSTPQEAQQRLELLTNYMPILSSVDRGTLQQADAKFITTAVKRIYRERVLEAGFDTPLLFQRDLQNLTQEQRAALEEVKIAAGKNPPVTREKIRHDIPIVSNGLDKYEFAETDAELNAEIKTLEDKPRKELTPAEKEALDEKKAEQARRQNIRNILRTISVRIPAMCIGLVSEGTQKIKELKEDFTLEKFAEAFDEESWSEFFGTIGKETFLTLAPCFDSEILQVAVAGWIKEIEDVLNIRKEAERLKKSDGVEPFQEKMREFQDGVKHVMSRIKNPNKETVFTPYNVVELVYEAAGFTSNQKLIDEMRASYGLKEMIESQPIVNEDPLIVGCLFGKPWTGLRGAIVPSPNDLGKPIEPGAYSTFYDINVKSGLFPLYAASQLAINNPSLGWEEICNNSIYANSRTLAGKWITAALLGMPKDWENITVIDVYEELNSEDLMDAFPKDEEAKQEFLGHFLLAPLAAKQGLNLHISDITKESHRTAVIEIIKARRAEMKDKEQPELGSGLRDKLNQELDLRFDFIISNPPYQISTATTSEQQMPTVTNIFHFFQILGCHIGKRATMIYPAGRWLQHSGKNLKSFAINMANDPRTTSIQIYGNGDFTEKKVFPNTRIPDGVCILNWNSDVSQTQLRINGTLIDRPGTDILPMDVEMSSIISKIQERSELLGLKPLSNRVSARSLYSIESSFAELNPELVFSVEKYPKPPEHLEKPIKLFTNDKAGTGGKPVWFWTERSNIKTNSEIIDKYQVTTGSAIRGKNQIKMEIIPSGSAHGRSRLSIAHFDNLEEAESCGSYLGTKLVQRLFMASIDAGLSGFGRFVPDLGKYHGTYTDESVYSLFELTKKEIIVIEESDGTK